MSAQLTWVRRSGGIPSHMRIRIRAVPTSSRSTSCSRRPGPDRRRQWSSPKSWCNRDICSTSGAIHDPWRALAQRRRRRRRSEGIPCRAEPWFSRCRSRWCVEPHRCIVKDHLRYLGSYLFGWWSQSLNRTNWGKAIHLFVHYLINSGKQSDIFGIYIKCNKKIISQKKIFIFLAFLFYFYGSFVQSQQKQDYMQIIE